MRRSVLSSALVVCISLGAMAAPATAAPTNTGSTTSFPAAMGSVEDVAATSSFGKDGEKSSFQQLSSRFNWARTHGGETYEEYKERCEPKSNESGEIVNGGGVPSIACKGDDAAPVSELEYRMANGYILMAVVALIGGAIAAAVPFLRTLLPTP